MDFVGIGLGVAGVATTVWIGVSANRFAKGQLVAAETDRRRDFIAQVDAVARLRERRLLGEDVEVRELERALEIFEALVLNPRFLQDLVERDCNVIETVGMEDRPGFVEIVDEMRAINARRWLIDPSVSDPNMAYWGGRVPLSGGGTLRA